MNPITLSTTDLSDTDLVIINVLVTQSKHDKDAVIRACRFVLEKLEGAEN